MNDRDLQKFNKELPWLFILDLSIDFHRRGKVVAKGDNYEMEWRQRTRSHNHLGQRT